MTTARIDLLAARRVLCIQPHYDDNDLFAGGTIAALHDAGAEIDYLTATDDLVGVLDQSLTAEEMTARLRAEQMEAGAVIGVDAHFWLGFPDAGNYDYYELRKGIIRHIRMLRPDFILTVDPWLPYEAHRDHILTGQAASEAALLYGFSRLTTDPAIDEHYSPHTLQGVAYYLSQRPNRVVDISQTTQRKHTAMHAYRSQFTPEDLAALEEEMRADEQQAAAGRGFSHGEELMVVSPAQLHGHAKTWQA